MPARAIPAGYHSITPLLTIRGAGRALAWYKEVLGAREIARFDAPDGSVLHAEIQVGDSRLMMSDEDPASGWLSPQTLHGSAIGLFVYTDDADGVWERAVESGALPKMPMADMLWGDRAGQFTDPFGHVWTVATHIEDLTPEQVRGRAEEFFREMDAS